MGKIVIYTRVSTDKQVNNDGESIKVQRESCEKMMIKEYGKTKEDFIYITDEGISGKSTEKRDDFVQILEKIKFQEVEDNDYIEGICCFNLSRLSRSLKLTMEVFEILKDNQVKLYTCDGVFKGELGGQSSMIMVSIFGMLNELYLINLREAVIPGMQESADKGKWQGGMPPLGYDSVKYENDKGDFKSKLIVNPSEAEIIKRIFNMYVSEEKSFYEITKEINEEGYKTKSYKKRRGGNFSTTTVMSILNNPIYMGKIVWGKRRTTSIQKVNGVRRKEIYDFSEDEIKNALGEHEPLIDEEIFFMAQRRMTKRKVIRKNIMMGKERKGITEKSYYQGKRRMFSNILRCPECGSRMTTSPNYVKDREGNIKSTKYSYICSSYNAGKSSCKGYYRVDEVEVYNLIKNDFIDIMEQQYDLLKIYIDYKFKSNEDRERYLQEIDSKKKSKLDNYKKKQTDLEKKIDRIIKLMIDIDNENLIDGLKAEHNQIDEEIKKVKLDTSNLLDEIEKEKQQRIILLNNVEEKDKVDDFEAYFSNLSINKQRSLMEQVYTELVIDTEAKTRKKNRTYEIKKMVKRNKSNIRSVCNVLGINFEEFKSIVEKNGGKISSYRKHFKNDEDYLRAVIYGGDEEKERLNKYIEDLGVEIYERDEEYKSIKCDVNEIINIILNDKQKEQLDSLYGDTEKQIEFLFKIRNGIENRIKIAKQNNDIDKEKKLQTIVSLMTELQMSISVVGGWTTS